ncbi:MAG: hypothetical protein Q8O03_04050 [Nanoarchaeota archaeon]|nr:hypothetical protein [Nanoarchaeota archaeon]
MEDLVKSLKEKLPKDSIHSGMIISIVKEKKIKDKQELVTFLQDQETVCREWLAKNRGQTLSPKRRDYSRKIEEINAMQEIVNKV